MSQITPDCLEFLEKAKHAFESNYLSVTYREEGFIALRTGMRENNISIYELGDKVGNFTEAIPKPTKEDYMKELEYALSNIFWFENSDFYSDVTNEINKLYKVYMEKNGFINSL